MEQAQSIRFFNRGPSPMARMIFFVVLSIFLLFVDARYQYLESIRSVMSVMTYPLQRVAAFPMEAWRLSSDYLTLQDNLVQENAELRRQHTMNAQKLLQFQSLKLENDNLRQLLGVQLRADYPTMLAEIVFAEQDIFRRKIYINKGEPDGARPGQIVIDDGGVVGQITRVFPWLSEVTLITDKDHAVPVQVLRNGLRTVVFGSGDTSELSLRYVSSSADIQEGDVLVTSGIDGVYPPGLPVAKVEQIEFDPAYPFARIHCSPVAGVGMQRHLLILTKLPEMPERPNTSTSKSEQGNLAQRKNP